MKALRRFRARGFTLLELLVAIAVLSMISVLIYSAFAAMRRSKEGLTRIQDRYREGRVAMFRVTRDLESAYLSLHRPISDALIVQRTAFKGTSGNPADRIDFNSFANVRRDRDAHEADQAEVSYFGSRDPEDTDKIDLVRRASTRLDLEPERGGRVEVLATDIDLFHVEYFDPQLGEWRETWDTTQATEQPDRLPFRVRITLILNGGGRASSETGRGTIRLQTSVEPQIRLPLNFAIL